MFTVSRVLSTWESQGLVAGGRQKIMIREPHKLLLLAEGSPG
jgi:CRP/FNR family transcriptional regulator, nitrogen oxide reductase regulator